MICLSCVSAAVTKDGVANGERVCLAAEGFGNRMCSLQNMANKVKMLFILGMAHLKMIFHSPIFISGQQKMPVNLQIGSLA